MALRSAKESCLVPDGPLSLRATRPLLVVVVGLAVVVVAEVAVVVGLTLLMVVWPEVEATALLEEVLAADGAVVISAD